MTTLFFFLFLLFYLSLFFSFFFFFLSFLEWDPIKSCVMMCLGVLFMSCYLSVGVHVWYCYFVVLIFVSGIFSLLTYFCSVCYVVDTYSYYYYWCFFFVFVCFFFSVDPVFFSFYMDFNFLSVYYDFSYYYVFWIVFVLFLLLVLISFGFDGGGFIRDV